MKIASVRRDGVATWGLVTDDGGFVDIGARHPNRPTLLSALDAGELHVLAAAAGTDADVAVADVVLAPVIPTPRQIFCVGLNYVEHLIETERDPSANPSIFLRLPSSLAAHGEDIVKPAESTRFDYEGELAVVIGNGGRRIREEQAWEHIAGYSVFQDGSARDWQNHTSQWAPGKNFPRTGAFGPHLVTSDEIADIASSSLVTRVNGEERQRALVAQMTFPIPAVIAYLSTFAELLPGDVIATGTPGGVGSRRTPPSFLADGDVVEVEIDGVGQLRNTVVGEHL